MSSPLPGGVFVGSGAPKKGIYLREPCEMGTQQVMVSVTPRMQDQSSAPTGSRVMKSDNQLRIDFESHVLLVPTEDWIKVPSGLVLMATGRGTSQYFCVDILFSLFSSSCASGSQSRRCARRHPVFQ